MSETSLTTPQGRQMWKLLLIAVVALPAAACADLNPTQQRALTGTAAGAGIGAVAGAIGGNAALGAAAGAGAGLLGGLSGRPAKKGGGQGLPAGSCRWTARRNNVLDPVDTHPPSSVNADDDRRYPRAQSAISVPEIHARHVG